MGFLNFQLIYIAGAVMVAFAVLALVYAVRGWRRNGARTKAGILIVGAYLAVGVWFAVYSYNDSSLLGLIFRADAWGVALFWPLLLLACLSGLCG